MTELEIEAAINDITSLEYIVVTGGEVKRMREVQGKLIDFLRAYVANPTTVKNSLRLSTDVMRGGSPTRTSCLWYVNGSTPVQLFSISVSMGKTSGEIKSVKGGASIPTRNMDTTYPTEAGSGRDIDTTTIIDATDTSSIESTLSDLGSALARAVTAAREKLARLDPTAKKKTSKQSGAVRVFNQMLNKGGAFTAEQFVKFVFEKKFNPVVFTEVLQEYLTGAGIKVSSSLDPNRWTTLKNDDTKNAKTKRGVLKNSAKEAREQLFFDIQTKALENHGDINLPLGGKLKANNPNPKMTTTTGGGGLKTKHKNMLKKLGMPETPKGLKALAKWKSSWFQKKNTSAERMVWNMKTDRQKEAFVKAFVEVIYGVSITESIRKDYRKLLTERQKRFWDWSIK